MKISIINGPNLNLLGKRENPLSMETQDLSKRITKALQMTSFPQVQFDYFQSNVEGEQ